MWTWKSKKTHWPCRSPVLTEQTSLLRRGGRYAHAVRYEESNSKTVGEEWWRGMFDGGGRQK